MPMMRSESRTEETSGFVTMTAASAKRIARVAPRSMPAGLSQITQSNFSRSSPITRATPSSVISQLQTKIEQVGEVTQSIPAESCSTSITAPTPPALPSRAPCLIIDNSVRSGQVIDYPDGDVTVGSVSSGAEIVAGGSIHVYGTLRGRALAGTAGDPSARIFCRRFQPELLAINGSYRLADNFTAEQAELRDRPVQARLEGTKMSLMPLD